MLCLDNRHPQKYIECQKLYVSGGGRNGLEKVGSAAERCNTSFENVLHLAKPTEWQSIKPTSNGKSGGTSQRQD